MNRRDFSAALAASLVVARTPARAQAADAIASIEAAHGGRLGVFAVDTGTGRTLAHRADERFALQSTFKGVLAALILARVDAGRDGLEQVVRYGVHDLVAASPVTQALLSHGQATVGVLCQAILERSDNTAANLLLARVGGPAVLTAYVRSLGDQVTRFDSYEPVPSRTGTKDSTSPRAIAATARAIVLGEALKPASRALAVRWMAACVPGQTRLRAAFPAGWTAADRTGTGDGVCNDYAVAWPPGRAPLVVAAYHNAPAMALEAQEAVLRNVSQTVVTWART